MTEPRERVGELEARADLPDAPDRERVRGYAVTGLPFRTGHVLAMRRMPATSIGPAYTSLWHRDPDGRWTVYQDQAPHLGCPRAFGPALDETVVVPITVEWTGPRRFRMEIDSDAVRLSWDVPLASSAVTRWLGAAAALPRPLRHDPRLLGAMARLAGPLLRAGRVRLSGGLPSGQSFLADLRRVWLIEGSTAEVDGADLGEPGPLPRQERMADFWIPRRGIFAIADGLFEPYDPERHLQVASRHERPGVAGRR